MEPQKNINIRVEFPGKGFPEGLIKGHKDCVDEATAFNYFTQFLGAVRKNPVGTKITFEIVEAPKGTEKERALEERKNEIKKKFGREIRHV